ncbi:MAG: hypothetical protein Q9187_007403 [Circinaria calcarea]
MAKEDLQYASIYESTCAVFFFGTPHRGAGDIANTGAMLANIINACSVFSDRLFIRSDLVEALKSGSPILEGISESFRHRLGDFQIVTCYEGETLSPLKSTVVPKFSCFLNDKDEIRIPMNADHKAICRFDQEAGSSYQKVLGRIISILDSAKCNGQEDSALPEVDPASLVGETFNRDLSDEESKILKELDTSSITYYKRSLPSPAEGTYYLESCYVLPDTVCYFFCVENIGAQNNSLAILQSIIFQLLRQRHDLLHRAKKIFKYRQTQRAAVLAELLLEILEDSKTGIVTIIIDAVDECKPESRNDLLDYIVALFRKKTHERAGPQSQVKVLLTSRREPAIENKFHDLPISRLSLENHKALKPNIERIIHEKIIKLAGKGKWPTLKALGVEDILISKAEINFLWVTLVFELLERSLRETGSDSLQDIQQLVNTLPCEAESVYANILEKIPPAEQNNAILLLQIICTSSRPLTITELNVVVQLLRRHNTSLSQLKDSCSDNFESALDCLRGFVKVTDSKVYLAHQSAGEFLLKLSRSPRTGVSNAFAMVPAEANRKLAEACVSYLGIQDYSEDLFSKDTQGQSMDPGLEGLEGFNMVVSEEVDNDLGLGDLFEDSAIGQRRLEDISVKQQFYDYAALHWTKHFALCQSIVPQDLLESAIRISTKDGTYFLQNWLRYYWYSKTYDPGPDDFDSLTVAAFFGLEYMASHLIEHYSKDISQDSKENAMYWASKRGHHQVVRILLASKTNPDRKQVSLEFECPNNRSILCLAAMGGNLVLLKTLCEVSGTQIDCPDLIGRTPLFHAVLYGHLDIARWLIQDRRSNANHTDIHGKTMLFGATRHGLVEVVKFLLHDAQVQPNILDENGRSALSWAAEKAPYEAVEVLARNRRVNLRSVDKYGRTALCWAARRMFDSRVLKLLTQIDSGIADLQDNDGCSPLHLVVMYKMPHAAENIDALLATGLVDINRRDHSGRTPLSHAASARQLALVQLLLNLGARADHVHDEGRSPLA